MMVMRRDLLIGAGAVIVTGAGAVVYGASQMGSMDSYAAAMAALRSPLPAGPGTADLIRFATLAANSHNTQAWRFRVADNGIDIVPDLKRATPVVDPDNHHLFISLGCAAENLRVAAASRGMPGDVRFDPATTAIRFTHTTGAATETALSDAIPLCQSTRGLYDGSALTPEELGLLASAARISGVDLVLITDPAQIGRMSDLIARGNTAQLTNPAFVAELKHWMRFNPRQALAMGDGLFGVTSGNPSLPDWLGPTMVDWMFTATADNKQTTTKISSSAGLAVFVGTGEDAAAWVQVGRACQRFALQATAMGLKHAYLNQPVEVPNLRPDLANLIGLPGRRPDLVMRFGRGAALPFSTRRPVSEVMI